MRRRVRGVLAGSCAAAFIATTAHAQSVSSDHEIRHGLALREQGRDEEALAAFRRANTQTPSPRAQAYIALTCAALGQWVEASETLRAVLDVRDDPWLTRNRDQLVDKLRQVESHLGQLEVRGGVPGARVVVDGRATGALPWTTPVALPIGIANVQVSAPGYLTTTRVVTIHAGVLTRETVTLAVAPAGEAPRSTVAAGPIAEPARARHDPRVAVGPSGSGLRVAAWVVGAGGVVALGVGAAASLAQQSHTSYLLAHGTVQGEQLVRDANCVDCYDRQSQQDAMYWLSIGAYVGGAALVATAVGLALGARAASPPRASVSCLVTPRGGGCAITF